MAYRITADLSAREDEWLASNNNNNTSTNSGGSRAGAAGAAAGRPRSIEDTSSVAGAGGTAAGSVIAGGGLGREGTVDEEEAREAVFHRLETLGYRVGLGVVERYVRTHAERR